MLVNIYYIYYLFIYHPGVVRTMKLPPWAGTAFYDVHNNPY